LDGTIIQAPSDIAPKPSLLVAQPTSTALPSAQKGVMVGNTDETDDDGYKRSYGHGADNQNLLPASQDCDRNEQVEFPPLKDNKDDKCDEVDNATKQDRGQK
jgi:hypothetical protein